jgi:hypothetical protein
VALRASVSASQAAGPVGARQVASPETLPSYVARVSACPSSEEILLTARSS